MDIHLNAPKIKFNKDDTFHLTDTQELKDSDGNIVGNIKITIPRATFKDGMIVAHKTKRGDV